ncbi:MAG: hypothetical protein K8R21_05840 [Leptospira sp.]|nr:hypothetical protein [Leptospira sp.]
MFVNFFYELRARKIPVTTGELLDLLKVVNSMTAEPGFLSTQEFYYAARSCLVKELKFYDDFDIVFAKTFKGITDDPEYKKKIEELLNSSIYQELSYERKTNSIHIHSEVLMR